MRRALVKDGWTITHDPLVIRYKGLRLFIDLAAEKVASDASGQSPIAVEVKVFGGRSNVVDFEKAVGQYSLYREALRGIRSNRELILAVARKTYEEFFLIPAVQEFIGSQTIHLLIFDPEKEELITWIRQRS